MNDQLEVKLKEAVSRFWASRETQVPGLSRIKNWDLAYEFAGKFRLLVSLKSMLKNISGSVPNRLDDLQGEIANVQQLRPEIVIGYVVLFDMAEDSVRSEDGDSWSNYFEAALKKMAIRRAPLWNQGLFEGLWFIRFDSRKPWRCSEPVVTAIHFPQQLNTLRNLERCLKRV